jgi:Flp pilus assembly protein TadD
VLWRLDRREKALAYFRKAARHAPEDERIRRNLAMAEKTLAAGGS